MLNQLSKIFPLRVLASVAAIAGVMIAFAWMAYHNRKMVEKMQTYESSGKGSKEFVQDGKNHSIAPTIKVVHPSEVREFLKQDPLFVNLLQEFKEVKQNLRNLQHAQISTSTTTNYIHTTVRDSLALDSIPYRVIDFKTPWTRKRIVISGDSVNLVETNFDTLYAATYWKRKWLFGRKESFTEITFSNPNTKAVIQYSLIKQ